MSSSTRRAPSAAAATAAASRPPPSTGALLDMLRRSHGDLTVGEMLALAHDGDLGCRRVIADAGRVVGSAAAVRVQRAQPAAARRRRRPGRRRGPAARRRARAPCASRRCPPPPTARASSPACSASARRCWARSRSPSARPTRRSIFPHPSTNRFPEGEFYEEGSRLARRGSARDELRRRRMWRRRQQQQRQWWERQLGFGRRRRRQGRRPAAGLQVLGALGDGRPAVAEGRVRRRRRRGRDPERRGRQGHAAAAGGAGDHQWREGPPARQPGLRLGRRDLGERRLAGRQGHRLRPPDARLGHDRLLRLVQQREGRPAPGPGHRRLHGRQEGRRGRRPQRLAHGQQRDAVQEGLRLGHQPEVRLG